MTQLESCYLRPGDQISISRNGVVLHDGKPCRIAVGTRLQFENELFAKSFESMGRFACFKGVQGGVVCEAVLTDGRHEPALSIGDGLLVLFSSIRPDQSAKILFH